MTLASIWYGQWLYSELKLKYPGNRWKQMIAEGNKVVSMVTEMVAALCSILIYVDESISSPYQERRKASFNHYSYPNSRI